MPLLRPDHPDHALPLRHRRKLSAEQQRDLIQLTIELYGDRDDPIATVTLSQVAELARIVHEYVGGFPIQPPGPRAVQASLRELGFEVIRGTVWGLRLRDLPEM